MRILQLITSSELGGAQSVVANISNALSKEHEVIVAAGEGDGKLWEMLAPEIIPCPCKYLYKAVSIKNDILAYKELRSLYKKYKPDIIHLHSSKVSERTASGRLLPGVQYGAPGQSHKTIPDPK